ncbi:hypothetical protein C4J81_12400 [Deltaproteobacteria bacterium Smac51]|nr:hypothetical protein C4J81_12400 [Deltaproteobacteria bacterium Smac51]
MIIRIAGDESSRSSAGARRASQAAHGPGRAPEVIQVALLEFEGKSLEEAISTAAAALSLPAEKLKFTIISMGTKGFLGLGRRKAKIGVNSEDQVNDIEGDLSAATPEAVNESLWTGSNQKAGHESGLDFMHEDQGTPPNRPGRNHSKDRRPKERAPEPPRPRESDEAPALDFSHLPPPPTQPGPGETRYEGTPDRPMTEAREILTLIIRKMGFPTEVSVARIGDRIILNLADSEDNALLIGSRGNTLEALQLMTGRILIKKLKEEGLPEAIELKVVIDVADYRARRQTTILESLRSIASQVRRTRKSQVMNGLNGSERRLIQLALRSARDLSSRNDATRDSVIISPYRPKVEKGH